MNERELLIDSLRRLNRSHVTYYLTGSMASNYWGIPRTTHDIDFVIQLGHAAIPGLVQAFESDYFLDEAMVRAALRPPYQFNAIDLRSGLKIDFWLPKPEPFEQEMLRRRVSATIFGEAASIATAEDVILHKLVWNQISPSDRQLADAAGVVAVQGNGLNLSYLREWAGRLGTAEIVEKLLSREIRPKQS